MSVGERGRVHRGGKTGERCDGGGDSGQTEHHREESGERGTGQSQMNKLLRQGTHS